MRVLAIDDAASFGDRLAGSALAAPASPSLELDAADAHRIVVDGRGVPTGRCSLWWGQTPPHAEHRIGLVGHYAASDRAAGVRVLASACEELARRGCTLAVGPMDGSTWGSYRLVTWRGDELPFALEPVNPPAWPGHFRDAGFGTLATYTSAVDRQPDARDPRVGPARDRFLCAGIRIRTLIGDRVEEELLRIHEVASIGFSDSLLFSPLAASRFVAHYRPILDLIDPELVLLAEADGRVVGFLFMLPDFLQTARERAVDTAVLKTVAVLPGSAYAGLGTTLVGLAHEQAHRHGYRRVIHALMHDDNPSLSISRKRATPLRRYALFARDLRRIP